MKKANIFLLLSVTGILFLNGCSGLFPLRSDSDASTYQTTDDPREAVDDGVGNIVTQAPTKNVIVCISSVNVRSEAGMSGSVIGEVKSGSEVTVLGIENDWYEIEYNDTTGYVYKDYLETKDGSTVTFDEDEDSDSTDSDSADDSNDEDSDNPYSSSYDGVYGE